MNIPTKSTSPGAVIEDARIRMQKAGEAVAGLIARSMEQQTDLKQTSVLLERANAEQDAARDALQTALEGKYLPPVEHKDHLGDAETAIDEPAAVNGVLAVDRNNPLGI